MCYLELHSSQWLENLSNVYASCKVQCYGGPVQLQAVAKKVRNYKKKKKKKKNKKFCLLDDKLMMTGWNASFV